MNIAGKSTVTLSPEAVRDAIREYLNARLVAPVSVMEVSTANRGALSTSIPLEITFESLTTPEAER